MYHYKLKNNTKKKSLFKYFFIFTLLLFFLFSIRCNNPDLAENYKEIDLQISQLMGTWKNKNKKYQITFNGNGTFSKSLLSGSFTIVNKNVIQLNYSNANVELLVVSKIDNNNILGTLSKNNEEVRLEK